MRRKRETPAVSSADVPRPANPTTPADQQIARDLVNAGLTPAEITDHTGLGRQEVARVAVSSRDTRAAAKEALQAGAQGLAQRIVSTANVAESIDVLERIDVLKPKAVHGSGGHQVNIVIGMPNHPIGPDLAPVVFDVASASPATTPHEQHLAAEVARLEAALAQATRQP
jgi:hypothetical protein